MALPSNKDKLLFLSLYPSRLLSREGSQSLQTYFLGWLLAVHYWDFPKFGMLIRFRVLIGEHLWLVFRFFAAAVFWNILLMRGLRQAELLYWILLWVGSLHRHSTAPPQGHFPVTVSPVVLGRASVAAELGLAKPTLFFWFRCRRETYRTDEGQFSTEMHFLLYYIKQSLVIARPVAVCFEGRIICKDQNQKLFRHWTRQL